MTVEKIDIKIFLSLSKTAPVFDVRSPGEYNHAHLPGAYSLPLFTDEERKNIGTAYKQKSREQAIKIGLDYFGPKMRKMVEEVEGVFKVRSTMCDVRSQPEIKHPTSDTVHRTSNIVLVYCWRGGMRSAAVAWLLDLYGFKVYTLTGGYKTFRNYVLDTFKIPFQFKILGGFTGSGKTEALKELSKLGETVIDLEAIANHQGSAFGNIGLPPQPSQEMFENILALKLRDASSELNESPKASPNGGLASGEMEGALWLEDESQRIGHVNIPNELWNNMRRSPVYFLDIPFEVRLKHLVEEYGQLNRESMINAIERIQKRLGSMEAKNAITHLIENNVTECFRILLKYYDKCYSKSLHNREDISSLLIKIPCEEVGAQNADSLLHQVLSL